MSKENLSLESFDKLKSELKDKVELSALLQKGKDELQQKVNQLENENKDLQEDFDAFKKEHEQAAADRENLIVELELAKSELNSTLEANKLLMKTIDELSEAAPSVPAAGKKVADFSSLSFEKDGVKYSFNFAKITHKKIAVSAEEIAVDENLQDELIALKSGILKVL